MPTSLSNCDECHYNDTIEEYKDTIPNYKILTKLHSENLNKVSVLNKITNLPEELCIKIVKESNVVLECSYCITNKRKLCLHHSICAKKWAKHYRNENDDRYYNVEETPRE